MLCNFDEFWVFDFGTQMDAPVDKVKVQDLTTRWGALAFLFPTPLKPIFGNDQVAVTRKAADELADCFNKMVHRERPSGAVDNPTAQRFILQMLVALFAEEIDVLPRYMVDRLLADCKTKQDSRDLIGGLFEAMNTREKTDDDRYQGVAYFNGGCSPNRPGSNSGWMNWIFSEPPPWRPRALAEKPPPNPLGTGRHCPPGGTGRISPLTP